MTLEFRIETPADVSAIDALTTAAFLHAPHTSHTEQLIVNALRQASQLTLSLLAEKDRRLVGHVAISPVTVSSRAGDGKASTGWYGLGPISVAPDCQRQGIGTHLMEQVLMQLRQMGAAGCVLVGDPHFYNRFGFRPQSALVLPDVPAEYFMALAFGDEVPAGVVSFHTTFGVTGDVVPSHKPVDSQGLLDVVVQNKGEDLLIERHQAQARRDPFEC